MKRYLLAGVVIVAAADAAVAADMPVMRAPITVPVYSWTGLYLGIHGGWGFGNVHFSNSTLDIADHTMDGGLVGGHIGYNWQVGPSWLIGLEASGTWSDVKKTAFGLLFPDILNSLNDQWTTEVKWLATVTPRIGVTISSWMWYLKGGVAFAELRHRFESPVGPASFEISDTKVGWTFGFGGEVLLASNWILGVEGNLYGFGHTRVSSGLTNFPDHDVDVTMWSILGRISYKFGGPSAPVVARY
jgi:outer membrane immunogenic protein